MASTQRKPLEAATRRRVAILGATGSIGDSTLDVIAQQPGRFEVTVLTAQDNADKLIALAKQHRPAIVAIGNEAHLPALREALPNTTIMGGISGLEEAASVAVDLSVCAIVGSAGLNPTLRAIEQGGAVALANKEVLVCAGDLFMAACAKHNTTLLPVDSEHNAIFQVLSANHKAEVETITLTASGGPFLTRPLESFDSITAKEAVNHPRWNMGAKISVDSATMMNKGLELIEAHYLFAMAPQKLEVLIHPESIIHSLVHYSDGSVLAQLGMPDMRIPIGYALSWPQRMALNTPRLDLAQLKSLNFHEVEATRFPALALARAALSDGAAQCIALNAANEVAVEHFLQGSITFTTIAKIVARVLEKTQSAPISTIQDVLEMDISSRRIASKVIKEFA
jgi:1-deoxy-D-xylulose-5-phosphate reductoisomerase